MRRYCSTASFAGSSTTWGGTGRLVADAIDQQLFEPGEWGLRDVLSGYFCANPHVGHAGGIRPVLDYRITNLEAQIKKNKQNVWLPRKYKNDLI